MCAYVRSRGQVMAEASGETPGSPKAQARAQSVPATQVERVAEDVRAIMGVLAYLPASWEDAEQITIDLSGAWLPHANLMNARLNRANLNYAHLEGANLMNADLNGADFSTAQYLETVNFTQSKNPRKACQTPF